MGTIDILILVIIASFAIIGFKRGVFQSLVTIVGFIIIIYLAYLFKNVLGDFLVLHLPFTKYSFIPNGSYVLNVVAYEAIGFAMVLAVLGVLYKIVLIASGLFEKLLKITIILGVPSKILGLIIGAIEGYILVYFGLFILTQPFIRFDVLNKSKYAETILKDTPVLSGIAENTFIVIDEIEDTIKTGNSDNFDLRLADLVLKRKIASADVMQKLIDNKKLSIDGLQSIVNNYK